MEELNKMMQPTQRQSVVLNILQHPHPLLSTVSTPVIDITPGLKTLMDDMVATMKQSNAVGLAAVQVGHPLRVLVVQTPPTIEGPGQLLKVINPKLISVSEAVETTKEGCLSFMGLFINVKRPKSAVIEYMDEDGNKQTVNGDGLLARAIIHEMDHLDGKTFLDRVSSVERSNALRGNKILKRKIKAFVKMLGKQK